MNNYLSFNGDCGSWIGLKCHYILEAPHARAVVEKHYLA